MFVIVVGPPVAGGDDDDGDAVVVHQKPRWVVVIGGSSTVRTKGRVSNFNELLDSENDDDDHHHRKCYRDQKQQQPVTFAGFALFGGACVHTTIITVTAILIGLFFELRFHDAWSLYIW